MKLVRMALALTATLALVGVAYVSQQPETPATGMAAAAQKFVASLTAEQKKKALYGFDDPERTNWHFIPLQDKEKRPTRKGLRLEDMNAEQKKLALALLEMGTSPEGYAKATTIMSLESILKVLEKNGTNVRDPEWYFFTIFGTPGKAGKWGWRVEGHHLSINYTLDDNKVLSATPTFFGANPATVKAGPKQGLRTLPEAEDYAIDLFKSLEKDQVEVALQKKPFPEPKAQSVHADVGPPVGVPAAKMNEKQKDILTKLIRAYTNRMTKEVGQAEWQQVKDGGGIDKVYFAFSGSTVPGMGHTYRVQGPTIVIEFLNVQADSAGNPANHIHSCWRRTDGDFGVTKK